MSPVVQFALSGLLATVAIGLIAVAILQHLGTREAIRDAKQVTRLAGVGIVEPAVTPGVLAGNPRDLARLDQAVRTRVRRDGIVRVKVWDASGRVVYSDEPRLIGERFPLGAEETAMLRGGGIEAEVSDLSRPENRFEPSGRKLLEVYMPIRGPDGQPLLFEAYQRFGSVAASGRRLWLTFAPALIGGLLLLQLINLPLARSLARRLREGQREKEVLLERALDASQTERRAIAADLHDGVVQDLVGLSYALDAEAESVNGGDRRATGLLRSGASQTRDAIRALRTLLVDIYPPSLHRAGLDAALTDLAKTYTARGLVTTVEGADAVRVGEEAERLLFRSAQELLRNTHKHAAAQHVRIRLAQEPDPGDARAPRRRRGLRSRRPRAPRGPLRHAGARGSRARRRRPAHARQRAGARHARERGGAATIRVLIADDHNLVRAGLSQLLANADDIEVVGTAATGRQAVERAIDRSADIVLMDLSMPDLDGIDATAELRRRSPEVRTVALTSFSDRSRILAALDAGAVGYLLKDAEPDELLRGIRAAARGESPLAPRAAREVLAARHEPPGPEAQLTEREREILSLVAEGHPNKVIARRLEIAEKTVKNHLSHIFQVLDVTDRTQAALWARKQLERG